MAHISGIFAASHAPPLIRDWNKIETGRKAGLSQAFDELGRRIRLSEPDVLVVLGADHWANFFLNNMPAICIGVGAEHDGPPEQWLADYPHKSMRGSAALGRHMARATFQSRFEPSVSHRMRLDHAFCVPLWKARLDPLPPIVPIVINAVQEPMPTVSRCLAFGEAIAGAIESFPAPLRVVILASGGLSHSVGEPQMGHIDEDFDRKCIDLLGRPDAGGLITFLTDERMSRAGNGSHELRFWAAAHGAARTHGFELIHYEAVPETYTGCGFAQWHGSEASVL